MLYPWSYVDLIGKYTASDSALAKVFQVPSATLPENLQAMVNFPHPGAVQWLELDKLLGLPRGRTFLKDKAGEVWGQWQKVEALFEGYESLRNEMQETAEKLVAEEMPILYPAFKPAEEGTWDPPVGTFHKDRLSWRVMTDSYYISFYNDESRRSNFHLSPTPEDDEITYDIRDDRGTLLKAATEDEAKFDEFRIMLDSWLESPFMRELTENFFRKEKALGRALEEFRSGLQEVTVQIAYSHPVPSTEK